MPCGCQANKTNNVVAQPPKVTTQTVQQGPCDITAENLNKWESILNCVKSNASFQKTGVSEITVNQYLGLIQSAKNYTNDYCFYKTALEAFKNTVLPKIIDNEPICI